MNRIFTFLLLVFWSNMSDAAAKTVKEVYIPMDYSFSGYHASEQAIPLCGGAVFVLHNDGDSYKSIQRAVDYVSRLKPDSTGLRGAVVLDEGIYDISEPIRVMASGVVIRGQGRKKTVIRKLGYERGAAVYIEGVESFSPSDGSRADTLLITDDKVKAGAMSFTVDHSRRLKEGQTVMIVRSSTREWIDMLGCYDFGGGLDYTGWKPGDIDITWIRTVKAVEGSRVFVDAPLTCSIDSKNSSGMVITCRNVGEIRESGVEDLSITSVHNDWNSKDEDHCWNGVWMDNAADCWVRRMNFSSLSGSAVILQKNTRRVTVEDCVSDEPISETGGWRRNTFVTRGQQCLFQRCVSRHGIHDFAAGYCAAGPNAFVQCEGEESLGFSGSIGSWAPGLLFDIVNIDGNDIRFANLEQFWFGSGWNTANSMLWQCTASTIECYSPDEDDRNSANGCWGTLTGNGWWTASNDHVQPRSLFYSQLKTRLGDGAADGKILPRRTDASSSPTVEEAMLMAEESRTEPRLTMEAWIDSLEEEVSEKTGIKELKPERDFPPKVKRNSFGIIDGVICCNKKPLTGNRYDIPWWSGRVKDNFCHSEAKPAVTRFVPGREGTGWTDRIDSVVRYLAENGYCVLDHHYGLWYDLRRTDHERVRRADGNVWAPFYEQPFSRSGKLTAWDGLSRYDLTKPNEWYWTRLREFADKASEKKIMLFAEMYFQHNILEAGAHWVDCPWRPVNNINGTRFPEPVPFAGDKRVFMAEQFYDITDTVMRELHRRYIRMCLEELKDRDNVVHLLSAEYTGPLHFTRFWLETVAEWERETGRHPLIALSCTKDAQDSILNDTVLNKVVDIIDIRYWHYNTEGLWAPQAGKNMAPRQWMRKMKVGSTGSDEAYKAVKEYREKYPDKAVTFFSQQYTRYGNAIMKAGGSLGNTAP